MIVKKAIMEINKDRVRLLVAALRSGEYQQTTGTLERVDQSDRKTVIGNCCLGVACRVAMQHGLPLDTTVDGDYAETAFEGNTTSLPQCVEEWYGFPSEDPLLCDISTPSDPNADLSASELNDNGVPFAEIADWFEATYLRGETDEQA